MKPAPISKINNSHTPALGIPNIHCRDFGYGILSGFKAAYRYEVAINSQ